LTSAVIEAELEAWIVAVALDVTTGAAELSVGNGDHVVDAHLTTLWEITELLRGDGPSQSNGNNELHFEA